MAIVEFEFYKNTFYGDTIEESSFLKWESRAEDKLKALCADNLTEEALDEFRVQIQKAICALAEVLYKIDYATIHATDEKGNIKSMSSGGQSISFGDSSTIVSAVLADKSAQERLLIDSAEDYLGDTGLLYMGV